MKKLIDSGILKKGFYLLLISLILTLTLSTSVSALGLTPSKEVIDFEPAKTLQLQGRVYNNENNRMNVIIVPSGKLSDMIEIENQVISFTPEEDSKEFTYKITLPPDLTPGKNKFQLQFIEVPSEFAEQVVIVDGQVIVIENSQATVTSSQAIIQPIIVNVPYPGKYAEGTLHIQAGEVGEDVVFSLGVFNRGKESIDASGYVIIKGPTNEEIARVETSKLTDLKSNAESKVNAVLKTSDLKPGVYYAEAVIQYGDKTFTLEKPFSLGSLYVKIEDLYVENFRLGAIAKINVDILNKWNEPIDEIHGELQIIDGEKIEADIKTPTIYLPELGEQTITGYWDTQDVSIGEYDINVVLKYEGRESQKLFETIVSIDDIKIKDQQIAGQVISSDTEGNTFTLLIILVIILIVLNVGILVYFRKFKKQNPPPGNNIQQNTINKQATQPTPQQVREPVSQPINQQTQNSNSNGSIDWTKEGGGSS